MADPGTVISIVTVCIKGLQQVHHYCSEFQGAKRKVNQLISECKAFNRVIDRIKGSENYTHDKEIRETLDEFRQLFHIFHEQLRPLIELAESSNPNKMSIIRLRISATWKGDDIDEFRGTITKQATLLNLLLLTHTAREQGTVGITQSAEIHRLRRGIASDTESLRTSIYRRDRNYQDELLESKPYKAANVKLPLRTRLLQKLSQSVGSSSKGEQEQSFSQEQPPSAQAAASTSQPTAKPGKRSEVAPTTKTVSPQEVSLVKERLRSWGQLGLTIWTLQKAHSSRMGHRAELMMKQDDMLKEINNQVATWPDMIVGDEEQGLVVDLLREVNKLKETKMNFSGHQSETTVAS
ncbi:hypothetical protein QBC44DRAFT_96344 [Cladorrhinum sp. PSN332]|nr:hypothetical protein QBC44DRAFT_96344 [Cladorrhinum sp. PSN332]